MCCIRNLVLFQDLKTHLLSCRNLKRFKVLIKGYQTTKKKHKRLKDFSHLTGTGTWFKKVLPYSHRCTTFRSHHCWPETHVYSTILCCCKLTGYTAHPHNSPTFPVGLWKVHGHLAKIPWFGNLPNNLAPCLSNCNKAAVYFSNSI